MVGQCFSFDMSAYESEIASRQGCYSVTILPIPRQYYGHIPNHTIDTPPTILLSRMRQYQCQKRGNEKTRLCKFSICRWSHNEQSKNAWVWSNATDFRLPSSKHQYARPTKKRSLAQALLHNVIRKGLEPLTRSLEGCCSNPTELPNHLPITASTDA